MKYLPIHFNENSILQDKYLKLTIKDLIDIIFSHNEIIELCEPKVNEEGIYYSQTIWRGHAHQLPKEYEDYQFLRIFGCVAESIYHSDTLYIQCEPPILKYEDRLKDFYSDNNNLNSTNITDEKKDITKYE